MSENREEFKRRVDGLAGLDNSMGPSFTLAKHALYEIRRPGATAETVDWDKIHKKTIVEALEKHGQEPDEVLDVIGKFSPGATRAEDVDRLRAITDRIAPDLMRTYEEAAALEAAAAASEKAANGCVVKFRK